MSSNSSEVDMEVDEPWFGYIASGVKTVEGRLARGKYARATRGTLFRISDKQGKSISARVVAVRRYTSLIVYLSQEGLRSTLPGITSIDAGVAVYSQFYEPGSDVEFGVLAIELELLR